MLTACRYYRLLISIFLVLLSTAYAEAECTFNTLMFEGPLSPVENTEGFAIALATPEGELPSVLLSCEGVSARIELTKPFVPPGDEGADVPKLNGSFRSYFIFEGKRYRHDQSALISKDFLDKPIEIGMSVDDNGKLLPASDNYRYRVLLTVTIMESP